MQICLDEIVSIKKIGKKETIDITVSGDNLFFANDILTHNSGASSSEAEMTDTSDSFGIAFTVDLLLGIMTTDELDQMGQVMIKQLKNRYAPLDRHRKFVVGVDRSKMRVYDVDQSAQDDLIENKMADPTPPDLKTKFKTFNFD